VVDPAPRLPTRPSLEQLRKQAKELLRLYRAGDPTAVARLRAVRPPSSSRPGVSRDVSLADAQFALAREHGFESWPKLVRHVDALPPADPRSAPHGLSTTPPYYRIDWHDDTIEPAGPLSDEDWPTLLGVMREARITGLNANGQMSDAALELLAQLDHVTRLDLSNSPRVTDDGLRHLARMPRLQHLDLSGWDSQVTDRGLAVLRHLSELRSFTMCWPRRVTDAGVANLAGCDRLERVNLLGTPTGDGAVRALAGKRALRHFKAGTQVTAAGLAHFHDFPAFGSWQGGTTSYAMMAFDAEPTYLLLNPAPFASGGLERLVGLDGLFALNIDGPTVMSAGALAPLTQLPNLGWLGVDPADDAMRVVASLPRLRMLMCQDTAAGDDGFVALSRSQSIEYIWGRRCHGLTGRGFVAMAAMPALRGLSVSCKNVDDVALAALPHFPALREYMPMDVPDEGFRHVGRCARLEALWCMYCRDTGDAATAHVAGLPALTTYYAGATQITDRSLELLGRMPSLERLTFHYCAGVTDAGVAALAGLPRLRELALEGLPQVTRAAAAALPARIRLRYGS